MEEKEVPQVVYSQAIYYLIRSTQDCAKKCNTLKLSGDFSSKEQDCLKTCAVNQAIATKIHAEFVTRLADSTQL